MSYAVFCLKKKPSSSSSANRSGVGMRQHIPSTWTPVSSPRILPTICTALYASKTTSALSNANHTRHDPLSTTILRTDADVLAVVYTSLLWPSTSRTHRHPPLSARFDVNAPQRRKLAGGIGHVLLLPPLFFWSPRPPPILPPLPHHAPLHA